MPKTDVKKIESEDISELTDETLDRVDPSLLCTKCITVGPAD